MVLGVTENAEWWLCRGGAGINEAADKLQEGDGEEEVEDLEEGGAWQEVERSREDEGEGEGEGEVGEAIACRRVGEVEGGGGIADGVSVRFTAFKERRGAFPAEGVKHPIETL